MTTINKLNIAIVGASGRMGKALILAAEDFNTIEVTQAIVQRNSRSIDKSVFADLGKPDTGLVYISKDKLDADKFDLMIDFSSTASTLDYAKYCAEHGKPILIGTTGFTEDETERLKEYAKSCPLLLSANTSLGVNLVLSLLKQTAKSIGMNADIEIIEAHHRNKVDAPSGTAVKMGEVIADELKRDLNECGVFSRHGIIGARTDQEIGFSTIRAGDIIGDHTVIFSLPGERIEITHKATDRSLFAKGAMQAALWLSKQNSGWHTMQSMLNLSD